MCRILAIDYTMESTAAGSRSLRIVDNRDVQPITELLA
jgi:hypothetical protein